MAPALFSLPLPKGGDWRLDVRQFPSIDKSR
jgi:hypothetical protein